MGGLPAKKVSSSDKLATSESLRVTALILGNLAGVPLDGGLELLANLSTAGVVLDGILVLIAL